MRRPALPDIVRLLLSVAAVYGARKCPANVRKETRSCMNEYYYYLSTVSTSNTYLFTKADVEEVRQICQNFEHGVKCVVAIQRACPGSRVSEIQQGLGKTMNMIELCRNKRLYEIYAQKAKCFKEADTPSRRCYNTFQGASKSLLVMVSSADPQSVKHYCSLLETLVGCIKQRVEEKCGGARNFGNLVEQLVRPTVQYSHLCRNDTLLVQVKPMTTSPHQAAGNKGGANHADRGNTSNILLTILTLMLCWCSLRLSSDYGNHSMDSFGAKHRVRTRTH